MHVLIFQYLNAWPHWRRVQRNHFGIYSNKHAILTNGSSTEILIGQSVDDALTRQIRRDNSIKGNIVSLYKEESSSWVVILVHYLIHYFKRHQVCVQMHGENTAWYSIKYLQRLCIEGGYRWHLKRLRCELHDMAE